MKESYNILSNYKLLCKVGYNYIYYHSGNLYLQDNMDADMKFIMKLPMSIKKSVFIHSRLLERFFRLEPRIAIDISDQEFLLSFQNIILRININGSYEIEHIFRKGMNNPLSFCKVNEKIFYGEYFGNSNKESVSIYERNFGKWKRKFTFPPGSVLHIHQIKYDKFRKCLWILTGDSDKESAIWKSDLLFKKVDLIWGGSQKFRSCFLMPLKEGIAYATDTPLEENAVYFSGENDGIWKKPIKIFEMNGPCIYGREVDDENYVMATSVEPDASLPTLRYRLTKKLGRGVKDDYTHIIFGNPKKGFQDLCKFKKDCLRPWLFQFGNVMFPDIGENLIFATGQSLKKIDGKTIKINVNTILK